MTTKTAAPKPGQGFRALREAELQHRRDAAELAERVEALDVAREAAADKAEIELLEQELRVRVPALKAAREAANRHLGELVGKPDVSLADILDAYCDLELADQEATNAEVQISGRLDILNPRMNAEGMQASRLSTNAPRISTPDNFGDVLHAFALARLRQRPILEDSARQQRILDATEAARTAIDHHHLGATNG